MINLELIRVEKSEDGTFGVLKIDGSVFCLTVEDPDNGNKPNISCIPEGVYPCAPVVSPRFGDTLAVYGVQGRSHILFHWGNTTRDTEGCILLGSTFGMVGGLRGITDSKKIFQQFLFRVKGSVASLVVRDATLDKGSEKP